MKPYRPKGRSWQLRKQEPGKRLYRCLEQPALYRRIVDKRGRQQYDVVSYTLKGAFDGYGAQAWVDTLAEIPGLMARCKRHQQRIQAARGERRAA